MISDAINHDTAELQTHLLKRIAQLQQPRATADLTGNSD